jgi:hypothetical protein
MRLNLCGCQIYVSRFERVQYDYWVWNDPELLPYPINTPVEQEITNTMPMISASGDTLFFCSDRPGTYGGLDIWMSVRDGGNWSEPINLGPLVNSSSHELSPYYAARINTLFFDRAGQPAGSQSGLYSSISTGDNIWQDAVRMPENINPINGVSYDPGYDQSTNTLYFNQSGDIYRSIYDNGVWSDPVMLGDNINGGSPDPHTTVTTQGADITSDGQWLFCTKCYCEIDLWCYLAFAEKTLAIEDFVTNPSRYDLDITIYPNPSNSSFELSTNCIDEPYDLVIYNMLGQEVRGYHSCTTPTMIWNGTDNTGSQVASGAYFVRVSSGEKVATGKLLLQK